MATGKRGGSAGRKSTTKRGGGTAVQRSRIAVIPRERLAREIADIVEARGLTRAEAARIVGDAASQMSLLLTGKLEGFSTDRLLRMLLRLGCDIDLTVRPAAGGGKKQGKIRYTFG